MTGNSTKDKENITKFIDFLRHYRQKGDRIPSDILANQSEHKNYFLHTTLISILAAPKQSSLLEYLLFMPSSNYSSSKKFNPAFEINLDIIRDIIQNNANYNGIDIATKCLDNLKNLKELTSTTFYKTLCAIFKAKLTENVELNIDFRKAN